MTHELTEEGRRFVYELVERLGTCPAETVTESLRVAVMTYANVRSSTATWAWCEACTIAEEAAVLLERLFRLREHKEGREKPPLHEVAEIRPAKTPELVEAHDDTVVRATVVSHVVMDASEASSHSKRFVMTELDVVFRIALSGFEGDPTVGVQNEAVSFLNYDTEQLSPNRTVDYSEGCVTELAVQPDGTLKPFALYSKYTDWLGGVAGREEFNHQVLAAINRALAEYGGHVKGVISLAARRDAAKRARKGPL